MTGIIQCIHDRLAVTLSRCFAWQHWQGNDWTEETALSRIYQDALPAPSDNKEAHSLEELQAFRPFILFDTDQVGLKRNAETYYGSSGRFDLRIEQNVPDDLRNDPGGLGMQIRSDIGNLLASGNESEPGLVELSDIPGNLVIRSAQYHGYARTAETQETDFGDAVQIYLQLGWGLE